mgnify:CR=1 FL=1|jgi:hypothetical protein
MKTFSKRQKGFLGCHWIALPNYNDLSQAMGLAAKSTSADMTSSTLLQTALTSLYASVDNVDDLVRALSKGHITGATVGDLMGSLMHDLFNYLVHGDPFFFGRF